MRRALGNMESALRITSEFAPFSVAGVLSVLGAPSPDRVRAALDELQRRHPLLRARIVRRRRRRWFETSDEVPAIPLEVLSRRGDGHWREVAEQSLNRNVAVETGPLLDCTYLYADGHDEGDFVFAYDHSMMDATSAWQLYGEFLALCAEHRSAAAPSARQLPLPIDHLLPERVTGLSRVRSLAGFMWRQSADELRYRRRIDGRAAPVRPAARSYLVTRDLDADTTNELIRRSRQRRLTMNSVVAAALLRATSRQLHRDEPLPMQAITFADLRPALEPAPDATILACYIAMLRLPVSVAPDDDLWTIAEAFQSEMRSSMARDEHLLAAGLAKQMLTMITTLKRVRMGTTAVTYGGPILTEPHGDIEIADFHAFISNIRLGPVATAFVKILGECLSWDFVFLDSDFERATAEAIADDTRECLASAAGT